ncbi:MAG: class I SAM-dependent methyltransferase [Oscillospiraceae bacterium]|nr:class I SAM-dependent methyltransferase [Oscillospiraceae bacterium]
MDNEQIPIVDLIIETHIRLERQGPGSREMTARALSFLDIVGSMENLPFEKEEFDLIWSEGAIDAIGFEKGLTHWNGFLKMNGHVSVTCPCWFIDEHPVEVEKFRVDAGSGLNTIEHNISAMQRAGYAPIYIGKKCRELSE